LGDWSSDVCSSDLKTLSMGGLDKVQVVTAGC
jgi:hypothetical protein